MKTIKHIMTFIIVLFICTTIVAQKKELTKEQKVEFEAQLTEYFEILDLSEDQKLKFEEIMIKYTHQMKELKNSNKGRFAKYKEFKSTREDKNKEMKILLSDEQYNIYIETQEKMIEKIKNKSYNN